MSAGAAPARYAEGPPRGWRLWVFRLCRMIAVGVSCAYFPGGVEGAEHLPREGPYILAPVHRSYIDWLVVARVTRRRLRYIAKDSLWRWQRLGRFIELLGAFPVHRGTADREAFNRSIGTLEGGEPLVLFPEGTRRSGPTVEPVLDGAAYLALRAGVPVVPVGIGGTERRMPRGAAIPRPGRVKVVVGMPIEPPAAPAGRVSRSATRLLSAELRARIQESFDLAQRRLGLPPATAQQRAVAGITGGAAPAGSRGAPAGEPAEDQHAAADGGRAADDEGN